MKATHTRRLIALMVDADHPHEDRDIYYVRVKADGTTRLI